MHIRRRVLILSVLVLSLMLASCGVADPGSEDVQEAMRRISGGMEAQKMEFWSPSELRVSVDDPVATGEVLEVRLTDLQVQAQQPPGLPALRLAGEMQIASRMTESDDAVVLVNYTPRFLTTQGDALSVEPEQTTPLIETLENGGEVTVALEALMPTVEDDGGEVATDPSIVALAIVINYGLGDSTGQETLVFPLAFGTG
jgi:predicted small secreted protein